MPATFSGGCACGAIRVHGSMRSQIKYIATYQVAPISAITHIAPVKSIEPWKDSGKLVVNFAEPARALQGDDNSSRSALASCKSLVSNPSVNQW